MTNFVAWIPPAGEVVEAPVHPETVVDVIYSDRSEEDLRLAGDLNWSAVGDGPRVVAYAVIKPAPKVARERYLCVRDNGSETMLHSHEVEECGWTIGENAFLLREVLEGREVVAWAVVRKNGGHTLFGTESAAENHALAIDGTVVRLSGVMPNE